MAEGNWYFFHKGFRAVLKGSVNFSGGAAGKWKMRLLQTGSTPNLETSTCASLAFATTAGATDSAEREPANVIITASASNNWKIKHDTLTFTASTGLQWSSRYAVLMYTAVDEPIGIFAMSTGDVVASSIAIAAPAAGVFDFSLSYTLA